MQRLSIVIPALGPAELLERSLVSVLENRPDDCEIVVVDGGDYQDPYQLAGEVRFFKTPRGSALIDCLNLAISQTTGEVIHLLGSGNEVSRDWADAALEHFQDPSVAGMAPLVLSRGDHQQVVSAGIEYHPGGIVVHRRAGKSRATAAGHSETVLGCPLLAAFYCRRALDQVGLLDAKMGGEYADAELALRLRSAGWTTVHEPACEVFADETAICPRAAGQWAEFQRARRSERLFWRAAPSTGWISSLFWHPLVAGYESLRHLADGRIALHLAGRMLACCEFGDHAAYHRRLAALGRPSPALPHGLHAEPAHPASPSHSHLRLAKLPRAE